VAASHITGAPRQHGAIILVRDKRCLINSKTLGPKSVWDLKAGFTSRRAEGERGGVGSRNFQNAPNPVPSPFKD